LVIRRVVVMTDAIGPEPMVKVATCVSTVVTASTCSPADTMLVVITPSFGGGLLIACTGGLLVLSTPAGELLVVAAATGKPDVVVDMDIQSAQVISSLPEEVVAAAIGLLVVPENLSLPGLPLREVEEDVVAASTGLPLVVIIHSMNDELAEEVVVMPATSIGILIVVVVELAEDPAADVVVGAVAEDVVVEVVTFASFTGFSEVVVVVVVSTEVVVMVEETA
jgi:hypothetical protein